ncbi:spermatogenesis-associated protein 46 [Pezoporus wallicus]|uniref:spermatogenesis-associated protein 46 n=1 Tax=Pezoporus wallicus TaxID=35540 RepID=UPI0025508468|nr:spermatogenesis-associated protein 46 [Pezoporus wallicus]
MRVMESFGLPTVSVRTVHCGTRTRSPEAPCPCGPTSLSACDPAAPPSSKLPANTHTIYRPWFSPYSYFMCTKGDTQQHQDSPFSSLATGTQENEEADDLLEIVCSSSDSSNEAQLPNRDRLPSSRASITVQDILAASQQHPVSQRGYQCVSCCCMFPTLWSIKTHIQNSSHEGYSCKVYYRRLKALWEKQRMLQETAAPGASM